MLLSKEQIQTEEKFLHLLSSFFAKNLRTKIFSKTHFSSEAQELQQILKVDQYYSHFFTKHNKLSLQRYLAKKNIKVSNALEFSFNSIYYLFQQYKEQK